MIDHLAGMFRVKLCYACHDTTRCAIAQVTPSFPQGIQSVVQYGKYSGKLSHEVGSPCPVLSACLSAQPKR